MFTVRRGCDRWSDYPERSGPNWKHHRPTNPHSKLVNFIQLLTQHYYYYLSTQLYPTMFFSKPLYCDAKQVKASHEPVQVADKHHEQEQQHSNEQQVEQVPVEQQQQQQPQEVVEEVQEESTQVTLKTVGFDARFPNTNQVRNCWQNYVDYFKCVEAKGEDFAPCQQFKATYKSLCPTKWVEKWDEQRDEGIFTGLNKPKEADHGHH